MRKTTSPTTIVVTNTTTMCFWVTDICTICKKCEKGSELTCKDTDPAGYCERERTGPGIGSGKYLFPVHSQVARLAPCKRCVKVFTETGEWADGEGNTVNVIVMNINRTIVVDQRTLEAVLATGGMDVPKLIGIFVKKTEEGDAGERA